MCKLYVSLVNLTCGINGFSFSLSYMVIKDTVMSKERLLASHRAFDLEPENFSVDQLSTLKEMHL